jgi:hypothetical protein
MPPANPLVVCVENPRTSFVGPTPTLTSNGVLTTSTGFAFGLSDVALACSMCPAAMTATMTTALPKSSTDGLLLPIIFALPHHVALMQLALPIFHFTGYF